MALFEAGDSEPVRLVDKDDRSWIGGVNASRGRKAGVGDKVVADQQGFTRGFCLEMYATSDLEQKIEAVNRLELEVTRAATIGDRQIPKTADSNESLRVG